jgi:hypothetical protein
MPSPTLHEETAKGEPTMANRAGKTAKNKKKATTRAKKAAGKGTRTVTAAVRKPARRVASRTAKTTSALPTVSPVVEDQLAILQLLHKYCHLVDRGTADEVVDLFHRNAVLLPRYENDERYEGHKAVRGWYARYMETFRSRVRYLRHKIESPVIEVTGNEATSVCYLDADSIMISTNEPMIAFGRYDDKFIKDNGRWWFKERAIIVYYTYPVATYREGR